MRNALNLQVVAVADEPMHETLRQYRKANGVTLREVVAEIRDDLGAYGASWLWRREAGQVNLTRAQYSRCIAAIDAIVERRGTPAPQEVL